jgi:uncharacterized membrane protein (DUF485 family)
MHLREQATGRVPKSDPVAWSIAFAIVASYAAFIAGLALAPDFFTALLFPEARVSMGMFIALGYMVGCVLITYAYLRYKRNSPG